jgi:hypothetical protein
MSRWDWMAIKRIWFRLYIRYQSMTPGLLWMCTNQLTSLKEWSRMALRDVSGVRCIDHGRHSRRPNKAPYLPHLGVFR